MERRLKMFIIMLSLAVVGFGQSSGARLLRNDIVVIGLRNLNTGLVFSALSSSVPSDDALKLWGDKTKAEGSVTPSGNGMVGIQQLATSTPSPGVGHMPIHASIARSRLQRRQQKRVSKKRILQSTPSPGNGH